MQLKIDFICILFLVRNVMFYANKINLLKALNKVQFFLKIKLSCLLFSPRNSGEKG